MGPCPSHGGAPKPSDAFGETSFPMVHVAMRSSLQTIRVVVVMMMGFLAFIFTGVSPGVTPDDQTQPRATLKKFSMKEGRSVTLVAGLHNPFATIAVDGGYVYFASTEEGTIKKVPVRGGRVTTVVSGLRPRGLAVDNGWIYFAEAPSRGRDGAIKKVSVNGGEVTVVTADAENPMRVTVGEQYIYFCDYLKDGSLKKVSKHASNGRTVTLSPGLSFPALPILTKKKDYLITAEHLTPGTLNRISTKDGSKTVLLKDLLMPEPHVVDETHIYYSERHAGLIKKVPIDGDSVPTVLASGLAVPGWIVIDDLYVYFTDRGKGTVNRVERNGGTVVQLMDGLHDPFLIEVHEDNIFVVETYAEIESVP